MRDLDNIDSYYERLLNEYSHLNQEYSPCNGIENVSIIVNKKRWKKNKKHNAFERAQQPTIAFRLSRFSTYKKQGSITKPSSMPELNKCTRPVPPRNKSGHRKDTKQNKYKQSPFQSKFIANVVSEHRFDNCFKNLFNYPSQTKWKIYRCQLGATDDGCCCSCNSDAMFEVMKGLYDCYKAQNCDNCCCVLCSHQLQEERKLGEFRKSMASIARDKLLDGKTAAEKEKILNEMAKSKLPLPTGKTASEKALIDKIRKELGLPPSPQNAAEKAKMRKAEAAGIITPLEGKTPAQKEEILRAQANFGLPLPEGRTASEKALIARIMATPRPPSLKTAGLLTTITGKSPEQKEKILKGRAMKGLPLPEGKSASEKKLINKLRADLGLPKEPKTKSIRDKHEQAAKAGLLQPLEGKTPGEKENILKGLHDLGIPLPEGRTPSEKALIAKVAASSRHPSRVIPPVLAPSEKMRRAKAEGLLTPLKGKTPEQKERILKGLAMAGIPLPEAQSSSEKKLIDKVRADLGLPKEPKTRSIRDKHEQAARAGLLQPLEGKTLAEKEKTLTGLHDLGIPLPEGRTPSEKALIATIAASSRHPSRVIPPVLAHSEQMRRAKAEGLFTPLTGKTPEQKEKILKALAKRGIPLPEGQTLSEKKIVEKVRADLGLPTEPKTKSIRDKHEQAAKVGLLQPLEGKTPAEQEKILQGLHELGIPLPEGRTPSEKALIAKVRAGPRALSTVLAPSEKMRRAKAEGLITPLKGKTPEQKERILKGLAMAGIPLPEGQSSSEKKLVDKVRADLGLPKEPKTRSIRDKHEQAAKAGLLQPLAGKTLAEKEKTLQGLHDLGIPLPDGRTPSEKALIAKVAAGSRHPSRVIPPVLAHSEQMRRAKVEGLLTPLTGKTPEQKEKILKALANRGIPLPEGKTPSEKKLVDKVRADLGLPKEPKTRSIRDKHEQAAKAGLLQPLAGKTLAEKEKTLQGLHDLGIPLPEGRTPSEKALIAKVAAGSRHPSRVIPPVLAHSEQMRRAKVEGLLTPLTGKTPEQKEKILKALANRGIPLPEGKTPSEKKLVDKVRADLGLPKEPKTRSIRDKHEQAAKAGLLQPLAGKTLAEKEKTLQGLHDLGIPLPEGRTPSEKALIAKVAAGSRHPSRVIPPVLAHSEQMRRAKAEGLLTPLTGKTPEQKEKILKALANRGIPLPEGQTPSEKKLVDKVRNDLGLPKEPKTRSIRDKHEQAAKAGLLQPLAGKTLAEKEKTLQGLHDLGIPLPEGRTPSEKALIAKVAAGSRHPSRVIPPVLAHSEQMRRAKAEGLLTPLTGKTPEQKEKILKALANRGIPLPEGKTPSEKKLVDKVRADLGLPKEPKTRSIRDKHEQAAKAGLLQPLAGKTLAEKEKTLQGLHDLGIPLPEGRTPSEKALIAKVAAGSRHPSRVIPPVQAHSEQMRRAKAEGLLTPLTGKTPEQKEKILKALANRGIPLPEGKTPSEKKLVDKVRADLGLPKEPKTRSIRDKHEQAAKAGLLQPLAGKTLAEKEKTLQGLHDLGIPLPEGRTPSEKALIAKVAAGSRHPSRVIPPVLAHSEQMRRAKAEGLLTPLTGKTPEQKEKILKALANRGIPLPEGKTPSEKKLVDKVRADLGLPKEPKTRSIRDKHEQAAKAGLLQPLAGKTLAEKEKTLQGLHDLGIPLPEGRTPSEKALIAKVAAGSRHPSRVIPPVLAHSEQMRRAQAEGLLTPLTDKTPEQKEKILKALANRGIPLPEGKTPSEKKLVDKVRADLGLPKEPKTRSIRDKHEQAAKAGLLQPLAGKTLAEKEKTLQGLHDLGIPLPEGRTPSEKALIAKVAAGSRHPSRVIPPVLAHSEQMRRAKAEGLLTPLTGKTQEQKEKILKALANRGIPLPEGKTPSEKKLVDKVRADLGLPKEPKTRSIRDKHEQAAKAGLLQPLAGKTLAEKEKTLQGLHDLGIPLPEGRTPSEKALIAKVAAGSRHPSRVIPPVLAHSEQMRRAKAEGLLTPLTGKTPEQKEKILKALANRGIPLPEGKTPSEKKLVDKVRADLGLPKEPKTRSIRDKHEQAAKAGLLQPLEGKTLAEKEKTLQGLHDLGIPLPEGRTPSEKALIAKVAAGSRHPSRVIPPVLAHSEQMRRAKAEGLLTPLTGKTPEQKEKVLRALAKRGIPLPEGQSPSEKKIVDKVRADLGLPTEPKTKSIRDKHEQAAKLGLLQPLEGKTPAEQEKILQGLHELGIPLPEGRTPSEKALIAKVRAGPRALSAVLAPSEQMRRAKADGLLTPLKGKTPEQKEKILKALANRGIPLPEGQTPSEKKLVDKVRADLGLPKEPKTRSIRDKHEQAAKAGLLQPLEGKTPAGKEYILKGLNDLGIPLPEGRTPSEKALIAKVAASSRHPSRVIPPVLAHSEQMRRAKAEGLLTPLTGKTTEQKEKILKALANRGIPLPEGKTPSEKKLVDKVRNDLGLPKEPKTRSIRDKHEQAAKAGLLQPLAGKTLAEKEKTLQGLHDLGIPLPEGRTPSEKALIAKVAAGSRHPSRVIPPVLAHSEQMRRAKAEGLLTPLTGKTPEQKEKILKALANRGIPLPEGKTPSEKKLVDKVRADLGLPKEPKTRSIRDKHEQAAIAGLLQPLEGKTLAEKEKTLQGLHDLGIPLPEGRTPSEKALIAKVVAGSRHPSRVIPPVLAHSEQMRRAKAEGLLTPLTGKTPEQKEKILKALANRGIPLPEGKTPSEKKLVDKVRVDLGLPKEPKTRSIRDKHEQAAKAGLLQPLAGKTLAEKEKTLQGLHDLGIPLPEGRTPSEKALIAKVAAGSRHPSRVIPPVLAHSEQMRRAKAEGLLTPLTGKTPEQKEKILKALANRGIPLPDGKTPSEKNLVDKVRADLGLPKEPKTRSIRDKHEQAAKAGLLQPLAGKTLAEKEKTLQGLHDLGIPLPEGRTPSEKALIAKVAAGSRHPSRVIPPVLAHSEQMRRAKAEGLLTPLTGKTPEQKEKILKALANRGIPLPEGKTPSEKKLVDKVRADLGLPKEPKTRSIRDKHEQAAKAGLLQPLAGKTLAEKEKTLQGLHDLGIPLPEGRTPSEKALIAKVAAGSRHPSRVIPPVLAHSEQMRRAKAEGLLTPLTGKTPEQKEKILKALANRGIPLPEGQTPSEKKLVDKVRNDLGLPKEPKTRSIRDKHEQAAKAGLLQPLAGKTLAEKEKTLQGLHDLGIPLPEGRTPSEKALIAKVAAGSRHPSRVIPPVLAHSEQMRRAQAEGLLTPLTGKTPEQKEKILKALANRGIPLPEGKTPSEKKLVDKVRADLGLPKEPKTRSIRDKHEQAAKAGLLQPLAGKTLAEKEKTLQGLHDLGIPLPEGRTPSEKALIAKVAAGSRHPSRVIPPVLAHSEQMRIAKAEGLLTPLTGKTPEQKEKILKALANRGIPLPEGKTPSEKKLVDKVRADLGLPKEPKTRSIRDKHEQAAKAGLLQPLAGKTLAEKEKTLQGLHDLGIPLPEGRTPSEKALIAKVAAGSRHPSRVIPPVLAHSEQMRRAKAEGLLTPLTGKTPEQKEKILKALANRGIPLPEGKTPSEKKLVDKVRADLGLPKEPKTRSIRDKHEQAAKAGLLQPLAGKTLAEKEKTLQGLHDLGIPLPEGRTPSEKALIAKVAAGSRHPSRVIPLVLAHSEQMRRAKAEGLFTPLKGKTPEQKEKILRALANRGIPLPEGQSPSEKKLVDKVRADLGLPVEPKTKSIRDKHEQAAKAGLLQPLEGKTPAEKENVLKGLHDLGIPLPEGRSPSEKALIAKVKALPQARPMRTASVPTITSDKIRKAKAAGLFTPLAGKTPEQKAKVLQGLAEIGLPLPEGKTLSEKAIIDKIKKESGIPDRTPSEKVRKAKAAGLLTPLEGKSPDQKEKILRGRVAAGLPLPMYKTPSEKALIQKIKDDTGYVTPSPSERLRRAKAAGLVTPLKGKTLSIKERIIRGMKAAGVPIPEGETASEKKLISRLISKPLSVTQSGKLRAAKAAGLLTPLDGKTPAQKKKIVEGLAKAGLPLPEGKTKSEKSMIAGVKARTPPEAKTPSEKSIIRKAKAAGLFTPITGKAPAEKERILKGLAEAGLPLPVGRTASEKDLVKKIRAEAGLPIEPTTSEKKGKIRKKDKKVGVSASKRAAGIDAEEFQDIIKTTTCDRGCGCDKKKIKFKHSYVKIRVTSPDISSLCDCPGECVPGVKSGAFIDNEGIKVTIGSAVGIPSYSMECIDQVMFEEIVSNTDLSKTRTNNHNNLDDSKKPKYRVSSDLGLNKSNKTNYILSTSSSDMSYNTRLYRIQSENNHGPCNISQYQGKTSKSDRIVESLRGLQSLDDYKESTSKPNSTSSYEIILIIKNDMSLSTSTSNSMDSISLISVLDSSISSGSAHYSGYESTNDLLSINSLDGPTTSDDAINHPEIVGERDVIRNIGPAGPQQYTILKMSQLEANSGNKKSRKRKASSETEDPIVLFDQLPSKLDVSKIMFKIMSKKRFAVASSIFIVVPMSDDDEEQGSSIYADSITSIPSSEYHFTASTSPVDLGNSSSWFRLSDMCKTSIESTVCNTPSCFGPDSIPCCSMALANMVVVSKTKLQNPPRFVAFDQMIS